MKHYVFAVFDAKGESFGMPLFFPAKGQAIRAFDDQANDENSQICKHPGDYTLFCIGEYDAQVGLLTPLTKAALGTGVDYKRDTRNSGLNLVDPQTNQEKN